MSEEQQPTAAAASKGAKGGATSAEAQRAKANYKKTRLGWIPEDWEIRTLGKLGESIIGLTYKPNDIVLSGGTLVLRSSNIKDGHIDLADQVRVTTKVPDKLYTRSGDILICVRNGSRRLIGKSAVIGEDEAGLTWGAFMTVYRSPLAPYLKQLFETPLFQRQIQENLGATINQITNGNLNSFQFPLPSEKERERIAAILGTWDRAIATVQQLLAAQQKRKRGLMQELLSGKRRFEGFEGEWRTVRLGEIAKVDAESLGSSTPGDYTFRYISLSDVESGRIVTEPPTIRYDQAPSRARRVVQQGDILLATVRPNLQAFVRIDEPVSDTIASTGFAVISPHEQVNGDYVYRYLFSRHITSQINALITGSSYPSISGAEVKRLRIYLPHRAEQDRIASAFGKLEGMIHNLNDQLAHLTAQKRGLMQQLLTGRVRVKS